VWTADDDSEQVIALGKPVVRATIQDFMDKSRAKVLTGVLRQWIVLDRMNIVNNLAGMHWVVGSQSYQTNEECTADAMQIFWNAKNFQKCRVNFGRAATELRLTIQQSLLPKGESNPHHAAEVSALDGVLCAYWNDLEPASQEALRQHVGMTA
jgi:hypothetical protein